jgi:ElaB/YqjD/DUF883 family membrane-anchored ribosome-binding protein
MTSTRTETAQAKATLARAQLVGTLSQIQHRLSPRVLAGEAWDNIRDRTSEMARVIMPLRSMAPRNKLSAALSLGGALMRLLRNRSGRSRVSNSTQLSTSHAHDGDFPMTLKDKARSTRDYAGEKAQAARDYAGEKAHAAREYASEAADVAREKISHAREAATERAQTARNYASTAYHGAQDKARAARDRVSSDVDTNPILALVGGIAAGALVAVLLPRTRQESERLGSIGNNITSKARGFAQAARDAGRDALNEAGLTRDAAAQAAKDVAERARQAASLAAERVKQSKGQNIDA